MTDFDAAVGAFFTTLDAWGLTNQVTLFTESEFNRTGNANANVGTDHAWGGHHLVFGGAVHGGDLRHVPAASAQRSRRCGQPRQLDSDDVARSVRGDDRRLVRRAGRGDERNLPEPPELPGEESGVRVAGERRLAEQTESHGATAQRRPFFKKKNSPFLCCSVLSRSLRQLRPSFFRVVGLARIHPECIPHGRSPRACSSHQQSRLPKSRGSSGSHPPSILCPSGSVRPSSSPSSIPRGRTCPAICAGSA